VISGLKIATSLLKRKKNPLKVLVVGDGEHGIKTT
jgi:hypothetical protein